MGTATSSASRFDTNIEDIRSSPFRRRSSRAISTIRHFRRSNSQNSQRFLHREILSQLPQVIYIFLFQPICPYNRQASDFPDRVSAIPLR